MALNINTLKTRSLTALIFVAVMLVGLLWNFWSFLILFTIIHFGCWYEYIELVEKINKTKFYWIYKSSLIIGAYAIMLCCFFFLNSIVGFEIFNYAIPFFGSVSGFLLALCFVKLKLSIFKKASFQAIVGVFYVSIPLGLLIWIYNSVCFERLNACDYCFGLLICLLIVASIWINDTMAYIVGSLIGKTPFSKISPKKTWEGTIGGAILCVIVIAAIAYFTQIIKVKDAAIIAALCAIFGTLGDLFESKLKRMANVKDSGSFMPGHGGFLDRFDSLLFAVPAVWVYVKLFL